jgi:hypothetical protein
MKIIFETRKQGADRKFTYFSSPNHLATNIAETIIGGITNIVAAAVTVVVTLLILLGGLWLAYLHLPGNIFYIILAVLIADIALGIVLRAVFLRS